MLKCREPGPRLGRRGNPLLSAGVRSGTRGPSGAMHRQGYRQQAAHPLDLHDLEAALVAVEVTEGEGIQRLELQRDASTYKGRLSTSGNVIKV